MRHRFRRTWTVAAWGALVCALLAIAGPAWAAPYEGVPTPAVEGPIAETETSHIFMRTDVPLATYGYTEEEFFISGTGSTYNTSGAVNVTGTKLTTGGPHENGTYPFKTRIVVRRPIDPADFNGKVLAEWQNVTAGFDLEPEWDGDPYALMKAGYVYVAVDAQTVGVSGLKTYNSERYGSLEVGPSGDALSYDVYAAALKAIRGDGTGVQPLGDLTPLVTNVTATGASQSCSRLATYYNKVAPLQEVADDYLLTDCTSALREDIPRKVLRVISEYEAKVQQTENEYPTDPNLRHWEAAAGSHVPYMVQANWGPLIERDVGPAESYCTTTPILSTVEWPYAVDAGTRELIEWQEGGSPPPAAPRGEYVNSKTLAKNSLGIQLGGLRLPEVEVPVVVDSAENSAHAAPNPYPFSAFCTLLGQHQPLGEETLSTLYTDYGDYVEKVKADAEKLEGEGFLLPEGAQRIVDAAEEYPALRPTRPAIADPSTSNGALAVSWRGPVPSHPSSLVPKFVETHPVFEVQHRNGEGEWSTVASDLSTPSYTVAESQAGRWSYRVRSTTVIPAQHMEPEETIVSPWSEPSAAIEVLTGAVKGKLTVKAGQSVQLTSTAKASGNVTVKAGGALDIEGATLSGSLSTKGATLVRICGADVGGTTKAVGGAGPVVMGDGGECAANAFHGAVTAKSNAAGVTIVGNAIHSGLKVIANEGGTTVTDNQVAGLLTVRGNGGSVVDSPNEVEGKSKIQ